MHLYGGEEEELDQAITPNARRQRTSLVANLVSRDIRTTTGSNLKLLEEAVGHCSSMEMVDVVEADKWRIPLLDKLLCQWQEWSYLGEEAEMTRTSNLIHSLCINQVIHVT